MDNAGRAVEGNISSDSTTQVSASTQNPILDPDTSSTSVPSSPGPADIQVFSDAVQADFDSDLSSPPSSPPWRLPSPAPAVHKAAFSFLKRKRSTEDARSWQPKEKQPLGDVEHNVRKIPRLRQESTFTQMQIDLGEQYSKTCVQCGMEYIPSNSEDIALHRRFHDMNSAGIEVGKVLTKDVATRTIAPDNKPLREDETILMVDRRSSVMTRNKIKEILDVVNSQLSAPQINDDVLWGSLKPIGRIIPTRKKSKEGSDSRGARFKAFVYLIDDRCVGYCLMEKISTGFIVVKSAVDGREDRDIGAHGHSSSISISDKPEAILLGVTRIWTSRSFRRRGIAETLLECARRNFFYGMEVTKDLVAFSQPTESGAQLAKKWYGTETGWHVFKEKQ